MEDRPQQAMLPPTVFPVISATTPSYLSNPSPRSSVSVPSLVNPNRPSLSNARRTSINTLNTPKLSNPMSSVAKPSVAQNGSVVPMNGAPNLSQQVPSLHATPVSAISNQFSSSPKSASSTHQVTSFHIQLPNSKPAKPAPMPDVKLSGAGVFVIDDANDVLMNEDSFLDSLVPDDVELNSVLNEKVSPSVPVNPNAQSPSEVNVVAPSAVPKPVSNLAPIATVHPATTQAPVALNVMDPVEVQEPPSLFDGGIRMDMLPDAPTQAPITIGPSVINVQYSERNRVAVVSE